jgi:hypothetical protein
MPRKEKETFISLFRKLLYDPIWTEYTPIHRDLWLVVLLRVNHETGYIKTSTSALAQWVSYHERGVEVVAHRSTIMKVLRVFESLGMVDLEVEKRSGVEIRVRNWEEYQQRGRQQLKAGGRQQKDNSEYQEETTSCEHEKQGVDNRKTTEVGVRKTTDDKEHKELNTFQKEGGGVSVSQPNPDNGVVPKPLPGTSPPSELDGQVDALIATFKASSGRMMAFSNRQVQTKQIPEIRRKVGEFITAMGFDVADTAIRDICEHQKTPEINDPCETIWAAISMWRKKQRNESKDGNGSNGDYDKNGFPLTPEAEREYAAKMEKIAEEREARLQELGISRRRVRYDV